MKRKYKRKSWFPAGQLRFKPREAGMSMVPQHQLPARQHGGTVRLLNGQNRRNRRHQQGYVMNVGGLQEKFRKRR